MKAPAQPFGTLPPPTRRGQAGFKLLEMLIAMAVFGLASLGIWSCVDTTFVLSSRNTALNLSHTSLQLSLDSMTNQLRESLQVIDVADFDGTTFTHREETTTTVAATGNAVRFIRVLPGSYFMKPDDANPRNYGIDNPQHPMPSDPQYTLTYPNLLTAGNKTVSALSSIPAGSPVPDPLDLKHARLFPRFPYIYLESVTSGSVTRTMPGMALSSAPAITTGNRNSVTFSLTMGIPATSTGVKVPSCNQAFLIVESAYAFVNRGAYSELMYYPDAADVTRSISVTTGLGVVGTDTGVYGKPFSLLKAAGAFFDPTARGSLGIDVPAYSRDLDNTIQRRGGTAALINVTFDVPVETRLRSEF